MPTEFLRPLASLGLLGLIAVVPDAQAGVRGIVLEPLGSYREETTTPGVCRRNISEIGAYDPFTRRLFVTNYADNSLDIFDFRRPETGPILLQRITMASLLGSDNFTPTSVAVRFGLVAVAVERNDSITEPGKLLLLGLGGRLLRSFDVGSGPDMVTFSPNGRYVLAAVEGEPEPSGSPDPEGSVAIIDLKQGVHRATLHTADFSRYNGKQESLRAKEIRITPNATASRDMEPEFITVSQDSTKAWVTIQENNAIAVIDIERAKVSRILALGLKDHSQRTVSFDASRDDTDLNGASTFCPGRPGGRTSPTASPRIGRGAASS